MGVWEDALREAAAQRYAEVQALQRQRVQVSEQADALANFLDGMRRLRVRPQRHPFLKASSSGDRYRASRLHKIDGWDVGAGAVVTPDGAVYDMTNQDKAPCDLGRPVVFAQMSDRPRPLVELLRQALRCSMQNGG